MAQVMVCDDDKKFTERAMLLLHRAGYDVTACKHPMDVLHDATENRLHLVIFGEKTFGFDAKTLDTLHELAPHVPVIIVSQNDDANALDIAPYATRSLRRDASPECLLDAVARALAASRPHLPPRTPSALAMR